MKNIAIIGTRGIPAKYGGFETFAEAISTLLSAEGFDITVQCDNNSYPQNEYKGVKLYFSSVSKSNRPVKYFYEGFKWGIRNADIIIVASTAASLFYFLNIFRKRIILTNPDGLEYRRKKWSTAKKKYLKLSEMLAVKFSDYLIADSESIKQYLISTYKNVEQKIRVIEYGAYQNRYTDSEVLKKYRLEQNGYFLVVSRLEPENNLEMILDAYSGAKTICPLVIAGNILENGYVKSLIKRFSSGKVLFIGGVYDRKELSALRYSCKAYIHGHSVGGTNPSLLEAMGSRNIILAHDNEFNREVTQGNQLYFSNSVQCRKMINEIELMTSEEADSYKEASYRRVTDKYSWDNILKKYLDLFNEISVRSIK